MTDVMRIGTDADNARADRFISMLREMDDTCTVLELGTKRWERDRPTHHKEWRPDATWVMSDIEDGPDVDMVADAHDLAPFLPKAFDAMVAVSVWEHLARPWVAAKAAANVMRPGGILYVATHQTFPIHGYPSDYFRFSDKALALIFEDAGFTVLDVGYSYPCSIKPPPVVTRWNPHAPCYLNVDLVAVR